VKVVLGARKNCTQLDGSGAVASCVGLNLETSHVASQLLSPLEANRMADGKKQ
jgi:hypothetical protein